MSEKIEQGIDRAQRWIEVKVGAFVFLTLVGGVAIILALAQKRHVFERRTVIHTVFQDVGGLREGAPVRLSGVNIGLVSRIAFSDERNASLIHIDMEISRESLARIGTDTVARIGSQGLLGDKIIELSVSEKPAEPLAAGATIVSQPPADFNRIVEQASGVLEKAQRIADNAARFTDNLSDPKSLANVRGIVESARKLAVAAEKGPGLVHALFYDPQQAKSLQLLLARVESVGLHVDEGVQQIDRILAATDKEGMQLVNNLSRAAKGVGDAAADLRASKIIPNLDKASGDLAEVTTQVRSGRGTVGMAIMDPTVYEQLVTVLGGVARSRILRALVRYAIVKDDGQKVGQVVDEPRREVVSQPH